MKALATVLYEDQMRQGASGSFPLHDLVMRYVEDLINGETYRLNKLIFPNARKGIGNVLRDLSDTDFIAGEGHLFVLVDRDVLVEHLKLPANSSDAQITEAIKARSDAPSKLRVFFLYENLEDLLRAVQRCEPSLLPTEIGRALAKKDLNDRDLVLREVKKPGNATLRACVGASQPGLVQLAEALARHITSHAEVWP